MSHKEYLRVKATTPYYNFVRKFAFPSLTEMLLALLIVDVVGCGLAYCSHLASLASIVEGVKVGMFVFALPSIVAVFTIHVLALRSDPLFNLRRCFALSLFSSVIWIGLMIVGTFAGKVFHSVTFPSDPFYLGIFLIAPFRAISLLSMSSTSTISKSLSTALEPLLCIISASIVLQLSCFESILAFSVSMTIGFTYAGMTILYLEREGFKKIGTSPLNMFRGFLLDWLDRRSDLLEQQLEKISSQQSLKTTLLGFGEKGRGCADSIIVVSNFHPGPFLNVGSSALPHLIQEALGKHKNAIVGVPHGISGHEMNLVSQEENRKVIREIMQMSEFSSFRSDASRFVRVNSGNATASCQVFGECALVTITLSPHDMEDIPLKLGIELASSGRRFFKYVALVDAHNSIEHAKVLDEKDKRDIVRSASQALEMAGREPSFPFKFGVARFDLNEFTPAQGIGLGGLVAIVVNVAGQLSGYLIIDGNNMKTGLREKILNVAGELGIESGEIMTTDTHVVNGMVSAKLGYHPVGDAIDEDVLMEKVTAVFSKAKENLRESETSSVSLETQVKTLGLSLFKNMTEFIYRTSRLVALSTIPTVLISVMAFALVTIGL